MPRASAAISPASPLIRAYHRSLEELRAQGVSHELGLRRPFENLLADSARQHGWQFVAESGSQAGGHRIRPDGTVFDPNNYPRGFWESKDSHDDLDREIERKIRRGYPLANTIFEDTRRAVLYQDRAPACTADLADPRQLADLLFRFYAHTEPAIREFEQAVKEFGQRVPDLARGLAGKIQEAHAHNRPFETAFAGFFSLCQLSLNPNISRDAVDEMLVQHLLTERLFRTIFANPEFTRRNAIAAEVERVVEALVSQSFSRTEYLKSLDPFYVAIENAGRTISEFSEKQLFLNGVYERFFRGYSVKVADTHGIVYTPPQIVDYMCGAVEEALKAEFGLSLSSPGVNILDPCTGTGNFIVHLMQRISKRDLPRMYREQLFANEVMLMPYYIAALNIEHAYMELTGQYEPFEGLCFVDTLDLAEGRQMPMFSEANTGRVDREKHAKITVIMGNPPYNVGQLNENDNNKNRKYPVIDRRIHDTYARDSKATNKNALSDAYVKFFRWATDRLEGRDGIVCFVSNNSFVDQIAFDGMRKHLMRDFTRIDHIDLHGNVRRNPKLSGTTHNVFGIQVGVGITVAVRCEGERRLRYHRVPELWRKEEKLAWLHTCDVAWQALVPAGGRWLEAAHTNEFEQYLPVTAVFDAHCRGLETTRDNWVYSFQRTTAAENVQRFIETYNSEVDRWRRSKRTDLDDFVLADEKRIKWSSTLKQKLTQGTYAAFDSNDIRPADYRPFSRQNVFLDRVLIHRPAIWAQLFPPARAENRVLAVSDIGYRATDLQLVGDCARA